MVAFNPAGPTGFGPTAGPTNADGVGFVDTVDGVPTAGPLIVPSAAIPPPTFGQFIQTPATISDVSGVPSQNAILCELRVISTLLQMQMGASAPDLTQLRADALWETTLGSSAGIN